MPDPDALAAGSVLVEVEKFGFSANHITYASLGETMRYWQFFPRVDGWGRVPVWRSSTSPATSVLGDVRRHAGDALRRTVVVGATHREQRASGAPLGGEDSDFFFLAPWMERRRSEWGRGEFARRYGEAWNGFLPTVERWMLVEHHRGPAEAEAVYRHVLAGEADPAVGFMLSLRR